MIKQAYHFPALCFNFHFLSQLPCCFATSPLTKGGKPLQITTHCSSSLRDFVEVVAIHKPLFFYSFAEKKKEITIIYQVKELIFNFQFFLNPPVASQLPPLQREVNPPQTTSNKHKNRKEKEFHE